MSTIQLYFRLVATCVRSKLQYRTSFLLLSGGQFIAILLEFTAIWALFARFKQLRGWTIAEVCLFYGVTHAAFATAEIVGRGFDTFSDMVRSGDFDRFLLRPRSTALQVAGREFDSRVGRFLQAIIVLSWSIRALPIHWTLGRIMLLIGMYLGGVALFYGLFVIGAALAFWTVEGLEIMNAVTYGGTETGQYPLTIYKPWFRSIFTYIIPLACVNYLPARVLFSHGESHGLPVWAAAFAPVAGILFLVASLAFWRLGERHYCSTGS